jgi:hypothetical protein
MYTKKLICPKCGNTKSFRVDVELNVISTTLEIHDGIAKLDIAFPNDIDIMSPECGVCGSDMGADWHWATPHIMCPHCQHYVEGDIVETCPRGGKENAPNDYPACFEWNEQCPGVLSGVHW